MADRKKEDTYRTLSFWDTYEDDHHLWLSNVTFNGLFKINKADYTSQYVTRFSAEQEVAALHKQIVCHGRELIFIPELGTHISFYNLDTQVMTSLSVVLEDSVPQETIAAGAAVFEDHLWVFPQFLSQDIIIVDLKNKALSTNNTLKKFVSRSGMVSQVVFACAIFVDDLVWLPIRNTACFLCFQPQSGKACLHRLSNEHYKINYASRQGNTFWITLVDQASVLSWNFDTGAELLYPVDVQWNGCAAPFSRALEVGDNQILVLPAHTENIVLLEHHKTCELSYPEGFYWIDNFKINWTKFGPYRETQNKVCIFPAVGNMLLTYHKEQKRLTGVSCKAPAGWNDRLIYQNVVLFHRGLFNPMTDAAGAYEQDWMNLDALLDKLERDVAGQEKSEDLQEKTYGEIIYQAVRQDAMDKTKW